MQEGYEPILIAVNISTIQFRLPDIAERIEAILVENELSPEYLELELTERMAMKNPQNVIETMNLLHEKGIRMSIDDFGTGYSSLSYLKKFQIYKLKIDQSFVRDITVDADDRAIVDSIINMAKGLGLTTIAEGVETIAQLKYLQKQGCDEIQGYYYAKPLPAKEFEAFRTQNLVAKR
jgi:EAL domain-containing protein (putative c-di-GMP-specific phosphodiesterase class I)